MAENKALLVVLVIHMIYAGNFLLTKLAFDVGMNTFVFVFYRQAIATLFLVPIAISVERKSAPPLSFSIFIKIFMLSLFGITMSLNMVGVALKYTSASLGAATSNTLPVITFFLAVLLRVEKVNIKTSPGILKVAGVSLCIGGVATMAFFRGPLLKLLVHHHHLINNNLQQIEGHVPPPNTWIKGVFLLFIANLFWALWLVLQGRVLKNYPSKLLLTTLQCFLSTIQSFIIAIAFTRDPNEWQLGWNIRLLSVAYCAIYKSFFGFKKHVGLKKDLLDQRNYPEAGEIIWGIPGIVVTGITFYLQTWVVEKKGPVFLAMTTPLILVFTITLSAFLLGEIISLGSVLGALLLVGGLYFVLWGKTKEGKSGKVASESPGDAEKACGGSKEGIIN